MDVKDIRLFRKSVREAIQRAKDINVLLEDEKVLEYIRLINGSPEKKALEDIRGIIKEILPSFKVRRSNGIYVCTAAFDEDARSPVRHFFKPSTPSVDCRRYKDIETQQEVIAGSSVTMLGIREFETINTVLNPFDAMNDDPRHAENGYNDVRLDFFEACYKKPQSEAVAMIKGKYPSIGNRSGRA